MADQKISQLTGGGAAQATDEYVIARAGGNNKITGANVAAAATSVGTLTSLTVSGDLTVDTSTLKVDSTNNRVGIGTASPSYALHVTGGATIANRTTSDSAGNVSLGVLSTTSSAQFGWRTDTSNNLNFDIYNGASWSTAMTMSLAGNLAVDTNTLYVDAANNRVGIGLTNPGTALDITGASGTTAATVRLINSGTAAGDYAIYQLKQGTGSTWQMFTGANSDTLTFGRSGVADYLYLTNSGNLGLGVTPSAWGTANSERALQLNAGSVWSYSTFGLGLLNNAFYDSAGNYKYIRSAFALDYFQSSSSGAHLWRVAPSGIAGNTVSFTTAMTLDASGNLCVGRTTTVNNARFISAGSSVAYGTEWSNNIYLSQMYFDSTYYMGVLADAAGRELRLIANSGDITGKVTFWVGGNGTPTERGRFTPQGYFKASDNGTYISATGVTHEFCNTAGNAAVLRMQNSDNSQPYGAEVLFSTASPDNNTNWFARYADSTTLRCIIYSDGDIQNHDGVYGTISDERLKQDIVDAGSQWDDLKAVRFRKYRMKTDVEANPDAPFMLGVVAQELEQTSPGLVDEHPDFEEQEVTDEDGNVTTEKVQVGTTKTVKSSILLMKAAVALQEAMARIEALEVEVAALKAGA